MEQNYDNRDFALPTIMFPITKTIFKASAHEQRPKLFSLSGLRSLCAKMSIDEIIVVSAYKQKVKIGIWLWCCYEYRYGYIVNIFMGKLKKNSLLKKKQNMSQRNAYCIQHTRDIFAGAFHKPHLGESPI